MSAPLSRWRPVQLLAHFAVAAAALICVSGAALLQPVWLLRPRDQFVLLLMAGAWGLWFLWLTLRRYQGHRDGVWRILGAGSSVAALVLTAVMVIQPEFSRAALLVAAVLALGLMLSAWRLGTGSQLIAVIGCAVTGVVLQLALAGGYLDSVAKPPRQEESRLESALYALDIVSYRRAFPSTVAQQGGLSRFGDRYILVNGDGGLFLFRPTADGSDLDVQPLPYTVPLNRNAFESAGGPEIGARTWFRVADVLVVPTGAGLRLFATHHYWKEEANCWVMRVSALEGPPEAFLEVVEAMQWKTVYESSPCMPLQRAGEPVRFSGINNGGRMAVFDASRLLVTIGDHEMDGYATPYQASQDAAGSYGKTILVDFYGRSAEIFSLGHRNPQGLAIAGNGSIWVTEHGPQGGDELNLIRRGANYGWPLNTYGAEYGTHAWPVSAVPGSHEDFTRPFISWVPSIGISNVIEMRNSRFQYWDGDLLVASLKGRALWRMRVRDDRVVMAERIDFGQRIRDLEIGHNGELVIMADGGSIHFIVPGSGDISGAGAYRVCAGCHVGAGKGAAAIGPSLAGIVERRIAAISGFDYSTGMRQVTGTWTPERLDAFLASPSAVVPGTTMQFSGIRDPLTRKKLIEYLADPDSPLDVMPDLPD